MTFFHQLNGEILISKEKCGTKFPEELKLALILTQSLNCGNTKEYLTLNRKRKSKITASNEGKSRTQKRRHCGRKSMLTD
jgi:hypothetical protein